MTGPTDQHKLVQMALRGDATALAGLREQLQLPLANILRSRGASPTEAEDIVADIWFDCVPGAREKPSLLSKFTGQFSLLSWLARVATNRWIDLKRRGSKYETSGHGDFDDLPGCPTALEDDLLQTLLRDSLRLAFASCQGEALIVLRLVYLHGLTQKEAGHLLGWTEPKTSRILVQAMEQIEQQTLKRIKEQDAGLELAWEDFLGLCVSPETDFL